MCDDSSEPVSRSTHHRHSRIRPARRTRSWRGKGRGRRREAQQAAAVAASPLVTVNDADADGVVSHGDTITFSVVTSADRPYVSVMLPGRHVGLRGLGRVLRRLPVVEDLRARDDLVDQRRGRLHGSAVHDKGWNPAQRAGDARFYTPNRSSVLRRAPHEGRPGSKSRGLPVVAIECPTACRRS